MRTLLILLLSAGSVWAGPKYSFKDPVLQDEFENTYKEISNIPRLIYLTKAQLLTLTPRRAGLFYYCTDCTATAVAVSTAATPAGISNISSKTTAIN